MIYSFCKQDTGEFVTRKIRCPAGAISLNIPAGFIAVEGYYMPEAHRFDLETGEVIDLAQTSTPG